MAAVATLVVRQPLGAFGAVIVFLLLVTAVLAPRLAPHGAKDASFAPYQPPSAEFPMGTDQLGRDQLSRVIWGTRISLVAGFVSVAIASVAGGLIGLFAGYRGGHVDGLAMRLMDAVLSFPPLVLALALGASGVAA